MSEQTWLDIATASALTGISQAVLYYSIRVGNLRAKHNPIRVRLDVLTAFKAARDARPFTRGRRRVITPGVLSLGRIEAELQGTTS